MKRSSANLHTSPVSLITLLLNHGLLTPLRVDTVSYTPSIPLDTSLLDHRPLRHPHLSNDPTLRQDG